MKRPDPHVQLARRSRLDGLVPALAVTAIGLAVRLLHVFDATRLPIFDRPSVDAALYLDMARRLDAASFVWPGVFYKPPLYPYLLATAWHAFGEDYLLLRLPGILLGSATCGLVWLLGRRLFGARVAWTASLLYAFHRTAVYFDAELVEMGLVTCLHVAALLWVLRAREHETRSTAFAAGLLLGLGCTARPTLALFLPVAFRFLGRRRLAAAATGMALAVLPVTLHNAVRGRDFVLVSSNLGVNFHLGNNPLANGRIAASNDLPANPAAAERLAVEIAERESGRPLRPSEVSSFWLRRGLAHDFDRPGHALSLLLRKIFYAWNAAEISDNEDLSGLARHLLVFRILPIGAWLMAPLGLLGWLAAPRNPAVHLARSYVVCQILSLLPFFVVARFRLPWMPVLAVFAAWCAWEGVRRLRVRCGRTRMVAAAAAASIFCNVPALGVRDPVDFDLEYKLGYAHQKRGQLESALAAYRESLRQHPQSALARNAIGVLLARRGENLDEAARLVTEAIALDPQRSANYYESLAEIELARGDAAAAKRACIAGLAAGPDGSTRAALFWRQAEAARGLADTAGEAEALESFCRELPQDPRAAEARRRLEALDAAAPGR